MASGSVKVDGVGAHFLWVEALAMEVTPTMGTWGGGRTIPDGTVIDGAVVT